MPLQNPICAKCNVEITTRPTSIYFYRTAIDDSGKKARLKANDTVCSLCYEEITKTWITKPELVRS